MTLLSIIILIAGLDSCTAQPNQQEPASFRAVIVSMRVPSKAVQGRRGYFTEELMVIETDTMTIFRLPVLQHFTVTHVNAQSDYLSDEYLHTDTGYQYIVWNEQTDRAALFDSLGDRGGRSISIDSFRNSKTVLSLQPLAERIIRRDSLLTIRIDAQHRWEKYIAITKPDPSYADSAMLEYEGGLKDFRFSFSPLLDRQKHSKLCRLQLIYQENDQDANALPAHCISFDMRATDVQNGKGLRQLLDRFVKQYDH